MWISFLESGFSQYGKLTAYDLATEAAWRHLRVLFSYTY